MNWFTKAAKFTASAATEIGKGMVENVKKAQDLSIEWSNKDRAFILDKYKNGSTIEKMAATKVAKERGWKS